MEILIEFLSNFNVWKTGPSIQSMFKKTFMAQRKIGKNSIKGFVLYEIFQCNYCIYIVIFHIAMVRLTGIWPLHSRQNTN